MNYTEYLTQLKAGRIEIHTYGHAVQKKPNNFLEILLDATLLKADITTDLEFPIVKESSYAFQCYKCDKRPRVTIHEDRIEFEDNHVEPKAFSVDVKFPSGEMIFQDTYPSCFTTGDFDVNTIPGVQECSEFVAKQGMMHFFVGNSCPAVWKEGDTIYVGQLPEDSTMEKVGWICTDLWWVSFVDPVTVIDRIPEGPVEKAGTVVKECVSMRERGSVKVTPGTYRCTSYYHLGEMDYGEDEKQVYCKLELIGESEE
jgi:hypothetical protein